MFDINIIIFLVFKRNVANNTFEGFQAKKLIPQIPIPSGLLKRKDANINHATSHEGILFEYFEDF